MTETNKPLPKLLKARQLHSRIFAVVVIAMLLVSQPMLEMHSMIRCVMLWAGYLLVIVGVLGRVYCSAYIGGRKNNAIMRIGPFSVVRNPLYVASFLAAMGIGMQSGMWSFLAALLVAFIIYYPFVVAKEENFLEAKFGDDYRKYKQEVPRWVPNWSLWTEPEEIHSMPKFIRRTMGDGLIFFLPMPLFMVISYLQQSEVLPVWLTLP